MSEVAVIDADELAFDLFIGCVGYESRSLACLKKLRREGFSGEVVLYDYETGDLHSYLRNKVDPALAGSVMTTSSSELVKYLEVYLSSPGRKKLLVDVTSLDREKIAIILQTLFRLRVNIEHVCLCYNPQTFVEPPLTLDQAQSFGPVVPALIGSSSYSRESISLIVGAGFEVGRVIGAIDLLEPDRVYCFTPVGTDQRFEAAVMKNNLDFSFLEEGELVQKYDLLKPESLYYELRRIIEFELQERDVLILPLGPKIFAAISMVIAFVLHPAVMVWRHSTVSKKSVMSTRDAIESGIELRFAFSFIS